MSAPSLFPLQNLLAELEAAIDEADGVLDERLRAALANAEKRIEERVGEVVDYAKACLAQADAFEARAKQLLETARRFENYGTRSKAHIKAFLEGQGIKSLVTPAGPVSVVANGGVQAVEPMVGADALPDDLVELKRAVSLPRIRKIFDEAQPAETAPATATYYVLPGRPEDAHGTTYLARVRDGEVLARRLPRGTGLRGVSLPKGGAK